MVRGGARFHYKQVRRGMQNHLHPHNQWDTSSSGGSGCSIPPVIRKDIVGIVTPEAMA